MTNAPHSKMSSEDLPIPRPASSTHRAKRDEILIDEAALETFPASDPPSWTPTHAGGPAADPVKTETPRELRAKLRADVERLVAAGTRASKVDLVTSSFLEAGQHVVLIPMAERPGVETLEAVIRGSQEGADLIIGAQYETNPCATAVMLGLARVLQGRRFARTVRLVAYTEGSAGSEAYARRLREQNILVGGMLSLESVGFLRDRHEHGNVASRLLPTWKGCFVAFVGNREARELVAAAKDAFGHGTKLEARTYSVPSILPLVSSSDHRSFVHQGFPAALVTDTGPLRNDHEPRPSDLAAKINDDAMADLVFGLASVVARLAGGEPS